MRRVVLVVVLVVAAAGCGRGNGSFVPPGTYAGSLSDRPFILDVGDKVTVNRVPGRFVKRGVIELKTHKGDPRTTLTCRTVGKKAEELRCTLAVTPPGAAAPTKEVIDLMLL